jgi:speckle-type POZ protein
LQLGLKIEFVEGDSVVSARTADRLVSMAGATTAAALIRSSAGRALRSASAVVCKPVTGSHVLRVDGYSHLSKVIAKDQSVKSSAFDVGGHSWRVELCPNGTSNSELDGHIGVFLCLDSHAHHAVWASPQFSVLDQLGNPCSVRIARLSTFTKRGFTWGFPDFISKEELEKPQYLWDDSFTIQCDVAVTTVTERPDHMVFISGNAQPGAP